MKEERVGLWVGGKPVPWLRPVFLQKKTAPRDGTRLSYFD